MNKPVLYLLPGLMCDAEVWQHQAKVLSAVAEVRIPVFRGFNSLRAMAQSVWQDAPAQFSVVGHSMGGRVAMELMALALESEINGEQRKTITRFAVMDTGAHAVQDGEAAKRQLLLDAGRRKGLGAVADAWIKPMLHPDNQDNTVLIDTITRMILRNSVEDYQGQVQALLGRQERLSMLPKLKQKVWLICGDEDAWSPVSQHQQMQQLLERSELRVIKGAGHMTTMEQPAAVSEVLLEWMNENG
jgi:pimeloyl-ACP methyl ester carboxylesterase